MKPPYVAANGLNGGWVWAKSGVSGDWVVMNKVRPFVCALPTDGFSTEREHTWATSAAIVRCLHCFAESDAKQLIDKRPFDGWTP